MSEDRAVRAAEQEEVRLQELFRKLQDGCVRGMLTDPNFDNKARDFIIGILREAAHFPGDEQWISVKEKLPELRTLVLIATGDKRDPIREGFYNGGGWYIGEAFYAGGNLAPFVTHWRPLPAPPVVRSDLAGKEE